MGLLCGGCLNFGLNFRLWSFLWGLREFCLNFGLNFRVFVWGVVWGLCVSYVSFGVGFGLRCVGFKAR